MKYHISAKTKLLCLIGHPVEHSMSPIMHNAVLKQMGMDFVYVAFSVISKSLKKAVKGIKALNIKGVNVTIPHKQNIIPYLDYIDPLAKNIGAVNTIKNEDGTLKATNTDARGAKDALLNAGCKISGKNIVILGAGGAARALCFTLGEDAELLTIANRTEHKAKELAEEIRKKLDVKVEGYSNNPRIINNLVKKADILINSTPVGMFPDINQIPIPESIIHSDLFVFDIIYNPIKTLLINKAEKVGCNTLGGLDMLVNQGALAFEWWTGKKPDTTIMKNKIIEYMGHDHVRQ
ncbi:MAG: shikimate dehydrogenase [Candidatus Lokiarchaeota archaeon]|nr:shikimate dehydrogenase [Candidatus Lokiarchaeota archaeon]MBD3200598.1 shikimate dehydrogenase [Candidatus Lokiarchaeota archaeon]